MKIVIHYPHGTMLWPGIEESQGCGASDDAVMQAAKYWAVCGHDVTLRVNCGPEESRADGVQWKFGLPTEGEECDLLVVFRRPLFQNPYRAKKTIFWSTDDTDAPVMQKFDRYVAVAKPDAIIALSRYHKQRLVEAGADEKTVQIVPLGINAENFANHMEKREKVAIFASAPFKGLPQALDAWSEIHKRHPEWTLKIFSNMMLYNAPHGDTVLSKIYERARAQEGVQYSGPIGKKHLAQELATACVLFYPNVFPETQCVVAKEAIAAWTPVITTMLGALPETVADCGLLVDANPKNKEAFKTAFVEAFEKMTQDLDRYSEAVSACMDRPVWTWSMMAARILAVVPE